MGFTRRIDTDLSYDEAVIATKAALQEQGFGTLTEIDIRMTLKDKLGVDTEPQVIIGACNPQLAHRALAIDPRVATLLPCNVVVRTEDDHTVVEALDPAMMADVSGVSSLSEVADEAARRIQVALDAVGGRDG
jgi:uncharacterized protein (DUF302 family)